MSRAADRTHELLADRALEGLPEAELRELEALGAAGDDTFDLAAAGAALAILGEAGPLASLPAALAATVVARSRSPAVQAATAPAAGALPLRARRWEGARPRRPWGGRSLGWLVAAAAMLLAVFGWLRPREVVERVQVVEVRPPAPRVPSPAEAREALLAQTPDARAIPWSASSDPSARGATGDVVWSAARRQGYMRIRGLAANDPAAVQYQLWIFDATRDERFPVDGGVFDVTEGEVVVPIQAKIDVREAKLFAVTIEKPGGVVVSKRERIVLTAAL